MKITRRFEPVGLKDVRLDAGFLSSRQRVNREVTLHEAYRHLAKTGRLAALAGTWTPGEPNRPHQFYDSDIAKWLEAVGHSLQTHPDRSLQRRADAVIDRFAALQRRDGYLNSYYIQVEPRRRWTNLRDMHELYCAGHLIEAAVAYHQGTGKRTLLDVMCRYADHIDATFGPRRGQKRGCPGHEEIELAMVKLCRATGRRRYLDLATFFINQRGRQPHCFDAEARARGEQPARRGDTAPYAYCQAHFPVREQTTVEGHAVRATYLYSGMADVAAETADGELWAACRRLWRHMTERRMYVTGGVGSSRFGERFTADYDLPNETAYAETCAAIGVVFWAQRMLGVDPDARYADVMERALYNGVSAGVSLDGRRFFYANRLAAHPATVSPGEHAFGLGRQPWFGCACCPPNIARLLASLGCYVYGVGRDELLMHLYAAGEATVTMAGVPVTLRQTTDYPWKPTVRIDVAPAAPTTFTVSLRIPGWCRRASLTLNGRRAALRRLMRRGYARLRRRWRPGDRIELTLPMPVERVEAHPSVRHDAGRSALQRGPIVYCLEQVDNGPDLADLRLPRNAALRPRFEPDLLGGCVTIAGRARRRDRSAWRGTLYSALPSKTRSAAIRAVPYALWNHRGDGEMRVWVWTG